MIKIPPYLRPGDSVYLVASARSVNQELVDSTVEFLSNKGLKAKVPKQITASDFQFAGSDEHRASILQKALDDESTKAILFMRGGYGTQRILDFIDFSLFLANPKWMIGFSDVTALHSYVNGQHVASIHGPMASTFSSTSTESLDKTFDLLKGGGADLQFPSHELDVLGEGSGILKGGNLTMLQTMIGTEGGFEPEGSILFIEDLDEMLYHTDRMILHMRRAGMFKGLQGLLIGSFSDMRDTTRVHGFKTDNPFGKTAYEIIKEHLSDTGVPIAFGCPAGHQSINMPLMLGLDVKLEVGTTLNSLRYN